MFTRLRQVSTVAFSRRVRHYSESPEVYPRRLRREVLREILAEGPMSVAKFMQMVNTHPKYGYYMYREIFGAEGDFCTAPEFSQLFGEIIGISLIHQLNSHHIGSQSQKPISIIELGPGKGTLLCDVLRVCTFITTTFASCGSTSGRLKVCHLLERSPRLQSLQEQRLRGMFPELDYRWVRSIEEVQDDDSFKLIVANEFFDALPTLLFSRTAPRDPWREVLIDGIDTGHDAEFRFIRAPSVTANSEFFKVNAAPADDEARMYLEICPETRRTSRLIAELISKHGGLFCAVDYGDAACLRKSPSLRAIRRHSILKSPLESVGEADLSADVDFGAMAMAFPDGKFNVSDLVTQGEYLQKYGIKERLAQLLSANKGVHMRNITEKLVSGASILLDPAKMGSAYKVFTAISR